jgi:zinc protease
MLAFNSWMGEHRNSFSNLYQVIRETRGMNYGDYSYIEAFPMGYTTQQPPVNAARQSHLFEMWIRPISNTTPTNLHERVLFATRAALRELTHVVENGLPAEEVERTKSFLRNYTVNWGNTIGRRLAYAVDDAFYGMPEAGYLAGIRPGLEALTPEAVNEAISTHLQAENLYIVMITRDAQEMRRKLLEGVATNIDYAGPQPEEVLAEDLEIASFPIPVEADDITIIDINDVYQRR